MIKKSFAIELQNLFTFIGNYLTIIVTIIFVIVLFIFVYLKLTTTKEKGIITIAKVTNYEGAASGSDLYIDIYLDGKIYSTSINHDCQRDCIGNYFFIKVMRKSPTKYPVFYGNKQVPSCIIKNVKYFNGWTYFPDCDKY